MPHLADHRHVSTLVFLAALSLMACQAGAAAKSSSPAPAATPTASVATFAAPDVQALLANARAALRQHDLRAFREYRAQLASRIGEPVLQEAHQRYGRLLGDLVAAGAAHDAMARARFTAALRALCDRDAVVGAIEPCDADLAAFAGG